ncbi:MAG: leucine-rich repeat domain-containing protein [Chloroflexota bacterium]
MRVFLLMLTVPVMLTGVLHAQTDPTPYEQAQARIAEHVPEQETSINLCCLGLTEIPPEVWELTHLETLWLDNNNLEALPPEIGQLRWLRQLRIGNNSLTTLPPEIGELKLLEILFAQENQIERLPASFGELRSLQRLDLSSNQLESLPSQFGGLYRLQTVWLTDNQLSLLPLSVGDMSHFIDFDATGNPLEVPPSDVAEDGIRAIEDYYAVPGAPRQLRAAPWITLVGVIAGAMGGLHLAGRRLRRHTPEAIDAG